MARSGKLFLFLGVFLFILFSLTNSPDAYASENTSSEDTILTSDALKLFVLGKYDAALEAFQTLSQKAPKDIKIKRYIGACYFHLKRDEESITTFKNVLELNPADLPSHQFLAKAYLRQGRLDQAEGELTFIQNNDPAGRFLLFVKQQLALVKKIRESEKNVVPTPGQLSPGQFLQTKAAVYFMQADYEKSLKELEALETSSPQDSTVKQYKGITLDKLGRFEEAIAVFNSSLTASPENIAFHYFKAQTLFHQKKYSEAKSELAAVVEHDLAGAYKARAEADLKAIETIIAYANRPAPKPWAVSLTSGAEANTNATSESKVFKSINQEHAVKFSNSATLSYELFNHNPWTASSYYSHSNALYSDTLDYINMLYNTIGESISYTGSMKGRPLLAQFGVSASHVAINSKYYSMSASPSLTLIYSPHDWWRVTLSNRYTLSTYRLDGANPPFTSQNGPAGALEFSNNFYLNQEKTNYFQAGYDFDTENPNGANFVKNSNAVKGAYYFPLLKNWEGDIHFKYKYTDFPKYTDPPAPAITRFDEEYTTGASLNIPLRNNWSMTAQYNLTDTNSKDKFYSYVNHAYGVSLSYSF